MKELYTLADLRNWDTKGKSPVRLGVFGDPVAHSLSPQMQNAALRECGYEMQYGRFRIRPDELKEALRLAHAHDFVGVNLTAPHKIAAMELLDELDEAADAIGAVNTVAVRDGKLTGFNTDGEGFVQWMLMDTGLFPEGFNVFVVGAGGAARAVAAKCVENDAKKLMLMSRSRIAAEELRERVSVRATKTNIQVIEPESDAFRQAFQEAEILVSTIPPESDFLRRSIASAGGWQQPLLALFDINYATGKTLLMREAEAMTSVCQNGLGMLLHQGALAFELWFNCKAPIDVMRAALL